MTYHDADPEVQRVRYEVRRFRQHLVTYIAVVALLFIINVLTGGFWYGHWWFFWVALIWGVFLALQAAHLFGDHIGQDWEDRMVRRVMESRQRPGHSPPTEPPRPYVPPEPPRPSPTSWTAAATPAASPSPVVTQADVQQEPIITPPPAPPEVRQEPIITSPPASREGQGEETPKPPEG